jgi:hypothetical protein
VLVLQQLKGFIAYLVAEVALVAAPSLRVTLAPK